MESLTSPRVVKSILDRYGFHFTKSLGQNFLIDENILKKIVRAASIRSEDQVLEIGPGIGTLTRELADSAQKVVAVEIDRGLIPILKETLADFDNVTVVHGDILKIDIAKLAHEAFNGRPFKVVANLPYYITTPIIMGILEQEVPFESITVLIQKEVAERIVATPGNKDYGALSIAVQYYTLPRIVGKVPASVFMPPPKVASMIVNMKRRVKPPAVVEDKKLFFEVVRASFSKRRKTLLNNLLYSGGALEDWTREEIEELLSRCKIAPKRRAETLSVQEFALITNGILLRENSTGQN